LPPYQQQLLYTSLKVHPVYYYLVLFAYPMLNTKFKLKLSKKNARKMKKK
jgi:hypothetical protein